ncbi:MAG: hypothetical protein JXA36_08435 [Coriobacteriia bacterium]|nr:hypothetical protein [Coriobacteriia bacterium]
MMRAWMRRDEGAVAVTVALLAMVLIIVSALVVDMGYWYTVRRQLQAVADSAALAGCRDLAGGASNQKIWHTVEDYATENAVTPVDNISVVPPSPGGDSDIGDDYVKVTVSSDAVGFFARALGHDTNTIRAQSKAQLDYLVGVQTPVPWALPILQVSRIAACVGGFEYDLSGSGSSWSGWLPSGSSGTVDIIAYNDQTLDPNYPEGVPEEIGPVARLIYLPVGSRFADVRIPQQMFTSGSGESVRVVVDIAGALAAGESIQVEFDKRKYTAIAVDADTFQVTFPAPVTDDLWSVRSLRVAIVAANKDVEVLPGEPLIVIRRSTYPIKDIHVSPLVFQPGASAPVRVEVELNRYVIGEVYEMKVVGGAGETGNFMAIDFHTLRHFPYWRCPQDPAEYPDMPGGTNTYYEYIAGTADYDFIVHIDDTVWTEPGNMSAPQTRAALAERFGTEPADYDAWVAALKPPSRRLVFVPVTEKVQVVTGSTPLRIVSFAVMYVEDVESRGGDAIIRGRFVDYSGPGWMVSPNPPSSQFAVRAPHLVADGVDF